MDPVQFSKDFTQLVSSTTSIFCEMDNADWTQSRGDGKWTRLQILGHLFDSAMNNHQRFVRALYMAELVFPGYDQEAMVEVQGHGTAPSHLLIGLWESVNLYIARVISRMPLEKAATPCTIAGGETVTLWFLIVDYVQHMQHHLRQIFEGTNAPTKWMDLTAR
ncbi:MAG: DinB family protein [Acidobacteria bacterium]|nr:DinB family protein [Acidobacteriota bacterium]